MALSQVPADLLNGLPPGANPVDAIASPDGGYWVLGSDGGVFAVGGAGFHGSYPGLDPVHRQGTRRFTHIIEKGGGYSLVSNKGEMYRFGPDAIETPDTTPVVESVEKPPVQESAKVWLQSQLDQVGLGELAPWALERFTAMGSTQGAAESVMIEMREKPIYKQKFPAMKMREDAGLTPLTEKQYMDWKDTAKRILINAKLPEHWYDEDDDFTQFIAGDVSPNELKTRVEQGYTAALQAPAEVRNELHRLYGITDGQLAAFFLDPDRGMETILNTVARAEISGAAQIQGFGGLTTGEAERLQSQGVGFEEASQGFGVLETQEELFTGLPGEEMDEFTREEQLGAVGGQKGSQEELKRRGRKRTAAFEGGGSFTGSGEGITGLGSSTK